jgi:RNA polymerase sigma factor (sigma-70 family)
MAQEFDPADLVAAALANDQDAARDLMRQLYPLVAKLVRAYRPARAAEEDLIQMIFVKIFRNLSSYSGKVPIEHWVSRIAINHCLKQIAYEKARPELRYADLNENEVAVLENLASTTGELAPDRKFAARELVEHLLQTLKPVERLVIDLLHLQQRSVAEIQELTGWSSSQVKILAFRARQKLRRRLARL